MGNRLGGLRQKDAKAKEDKQREKEAKKKQEKQKKKEKKRKDKNKSGTQASEWDTDVEESSHVTGGDSESCVFHSAENVSVSPYLDSSTRSELEQGATWSGMLDAYSSVSNHPHVLSSKDFKDGFSLEACIPTDIARPDGYNEMTSSATGRLEGHSGGSLKSRRGKDSIKSSSTSPSRQGTSTKSRSPHGEDRSSSVGTSSQVSGEGGGYSTPLLSTPVFRRDERCHSPLLATSALTRVKETDRDDSMDILPPSASNFEHHHFYTNNHSSQQRHIQQRRKDIPDFRNLPKPSSPQPQRRALSPKLTSSPSKIISSDESSSSPSTPIPQRRAGNFLDLFRSGSKGERAKKMKSKESGTDTGSGQSRGEGIAAIKEKVKSSPLWKTWERSSSKKAAKQNNVSIFGTTRKPDSKKGKSQVKDNKKDVDKHEKTKLEKSPHTMKDFSTPDVVAGTLRTAQNHSSSASSSSKMTASVSSKSERTGSESTDMNVDHKSKVVNSTENRVQNRNSSPPVVKSAAFCIMKLEELEKSIEKTIREKFPDAEPFWLRNRSKEEELRGSRSLPSTPCLQKKLYVVRDVDDVKRQNQQNASAPTYPSAASTKRNGDKGTTRYCDETYESSPSPAKSPVVLRRFGARTRHASISPKIQRAKTAALYNSPSEMSRMEESIATKTVTKVPVYHAILTQQSHTAVLPVKQLTVAQKSESKYDNVMDENDQPVSIQPSTAPHLVRQGNVEEDDSDEVEETASFNESKTSSGQKPVIVPTFSAVFGSVSPKLKRHLQTKFEEMESDKDGTTEKDATKHIKAGKGVKVHDRNDNRAVEDHPEHRDSPKVEGGSGQVSGAGIVGVLSSGMASEKPRSDGNVTFHTDGHRPAVRLDKQITIDTAGINYNQTAVVSDAANLNTGSGPVSGKVHAKLVSKSFSVDSAPSRVGTYTSSVTIPDGGVSSLRSLSFGTSEHHEGEARAVPSLPDQRKVEPGTVSHLATQKNLNRTKERETADIVSSPGSTRKHSTDHVVFGAAVALPCRLYASSPGPETIHSVNSSHIVHAHDTLAHLSQNSGNVKNQNSVVSKDEVPVLQSYTTTSIPRTAASDSVIKYSAVVTASTEIPRVKDQPKQSSSPKPESELTNDNTPSKAEAASREFSEGGQITSDVRSGESISHSPPHENILTRQESHFKRLLQCQGQQESQVFQYEHTYRQDDESFVLRRQPLSKVISDMISGSREESQKTQENLQLQRSEQRQLYQSSPVSPDHGFKLVKPAIAVVTSPPYKQASFTLEEKTVRSDSSASLPSSPVSDYRTERELEQKIITLEEKTLLSDSSASLPSPPISDHTTERELECKADTISQTSRSQEIQTDVYTTADKSVDSGELFESLKQSRRYITVRHSSFPGDTVETEEMDTHKTANEKGEQSTETDDSDESEFLEMVLSSKKSSNVRKEEEELECTKVHEGRSKHVTSPSAMDQLIEEFDEEGEDSEENENREIEKEFRRELEMKQFTDKIYKRLSDLLGSQPGDDNDLDDDVFEKDAASSGQSRNVHELLSKLEGEGEGDREGDSFSSSDDEASARVAEDRSTLSSRKTLGQTRILTIETSSSLTTTTSSDSDNYESPSLFQSLPNAESLPHDAIDDPMELSVRKPESNEFVFAEFEGKKPLLSDDQRQRRSSREYHSDDDVATGRGIPDYYDDRPLWSRRQKPPGQLSAAMMAIRRRERRERWLKKRRRNRTDLISTGSSDTGSEIYHSRRSHPKMRHSSNDEDMDYLEDTEQNAMGSGILTSPKYSKPILPFFGDDRSKGQNVAQERLIMKMTVERHQASLHYREHGSESNSDNAGKFHRRKHSRDKKERRKKGRYSGEESDDEENGESEQNPERMSFESSMAIPGIEETFNELMSVQNILEGMQDKTPTNEDKSLMPLTKENVRTMREYFKDSGGKGPRSRLSAADRTESDLDIYSETRDDASSDSNVYADDEEDDDKVEPYASAEDELGAAGGSSSAAGIGNGKHDNRRRCDNDADDDSDTNFVVGCTFYNSNAFQSATTTAVELVTSTTVSNVQSTPKATSASHTPQAALNSDEEFWAGGAAIEESYKQLETAADAVSSTFQNAREQMHDIQHHLQALRRQMEVLQDDLLSTSITLTPDNMPVEFTGK